MNGDGCTVVGKAGLNLVLPKDRQVAMGRKIGIFIFGFFLTTFGITLVLQQWEAVVLVFKAFIGAFLAVTGLVILFASTLKQHD